jgi:hypothetical protein
MTIRNTNDLMNALAAALDNRSMEEVDQIERATSDWLTDRREQIARITLIEAIRSAIEELS